MRASSLRSSAVSQIPHWTVPVSREETLAVREKFRKIGWRKPNNKPNTTKVMAWAKTLWDRHCIHIGVDSDQRLLASRSADFETWIDWVLHTTKKKKHETVSQQWKWLCQAYSVVAKQPMDCFTLQQVRRDTLSTEDLGILLQWLWKYSTATFANERQRVQMSLLMLFSAFTGSQPATMLETDNCSSNGSREGSLDDLSGSNLAGESDRETLVGSDSDSKARTSRPQTACYGDIDLFLLRNPDNPERNNLMAEVDFRNLKGRPEGAKGTKFLMYEPYRLAYCPIAHITSLASADGAFESARLTPEFLHKLRVPARLHALPLRFKKSTLDIPIFRGTIQTLSPSPRNCCE